MKRQSLGGEAELLAHGFHAPFHDGATTGDFVAKFSELRSVSEEFQGKRQEAISDQWQGAKRVAS